MRKMFILSFLFLALPTLALAHFGMVMPSTSTVQEKKDAAINLTLSFSHPMGQIGMPLAAPAAFQVFVHGQAQNLRQTLTPVKVMDHDAWSAKYAIKRPGVYQFVMEPQPYWEASEDSFIIHYTKTVVAAFGEEEGWNTPLGLRTEIVPLTRPFGNYAGNIFQGQVLLDGQPVPGCAVEVEFYNQDGKYKAPNEYFVTQVVTTDANGVFTYGVPFAGWWGFAALNTARETLALQGAPKPVELGAVLWTQFLDPMNR